VTLVVKSFIAWRLNESIADDVRTTE
jgi:sulfate transport system permease protein